MTKPIRGIYRDGVIQLHEPLDFPDNTPLILAVYADPFANNDELDEATRERAKIHEILVMAGIVRPSPVPRRSKSPLSPEREAEIAEKLAKVEPIYDIIREERDSN